MGPKKGKKGKGNKDEDWGDESEKLMEEKMKKLMTANNDISDDEIIIIIVIKSRGQLFVCT